MQDVELKAKVCERTHEDFIVMARLMGFESKSEYLRFIVERELYGNLARLQAMPNGQIPQGHARGKS